MPPISPPRAPIADEFSSRIVAADAHEIFAARFAHRERGFKSRARWRIQFFIVMTFDNFRRFEILRGFRRKAHHQNRADGEIGRD